MAFYGHRGAIPNFLSYRKYEVSSGHVRYQRNI